MANENQQTNLSVQQVAEPQYLTANHKREDDAFHNMTVKQKINHLQVLQKQKGLTNDQQDLLNKLQEQDGEEFNVDNKNLKKKPRSELEEPKDIFKDEDICFTLQAKRDMAKEIITINESEYNAILPTIYIALPLFSYLKNLD